MGLDEGGGGELNGAAGSSSKRDEIRRILGLASL